MIIKSKDISNTFVSFPAERLAKLFGTEGKTPREVASLQDGDWLNVSNEERMKVLAYVLACRDIAKTMEFLARLLERAIRLADNPIIKTMQNDEILHYTQQNRKLSRFKLKSVDL